MRWYIVNVASYGIVASYYLRVFMTDTTKITFSVKDEVLGSELTPENTTLPILSDFVDQVSSFIKGEKRVDLAGIKTSLTRGSLAITAYNNDIGTLNNAIVDYGHIVENRSIDKIDPTRAKIFEMWQSAAKASDARIYHIEMSDNGKTSIITIDKNSEYSSKKIIWVDVDLYLYGKIYDLGGKSKPNVHIELENGKTLKIGTNSSILSQDEENRLYKDQLVRIKAKRNIYTRELKEEQLISFEKYNPVFDEENFQSIVKKARLAWKNVGDASKWVEDLRSGGESYV